MMDFYYDKKLIPIYYLGIVAENLALDELKKRGFKILRRNPASCMDCDAVLPEELIKARRELRSEYHKSITNEGSEGNETYLDSRRFCHNWDGETISIPPCPISEDFVELLKYARNIPKIRGGTAYNTRTWDFTARKDDKIFLVEVKANKSRLVGNQRKVLLHAKKLGFTPLLIHIEGFEMKMRYKEIRLKKL